MTRKIIFALAALLPVASLQPTPADAQGVRLGFGFPMGSFVATPSRGGSAVKPYSAHKATQKKQAPVLARKADPKPQAVAAAKIKSRPDTAKVAAAAVEPKADTSEETSLTGSKALAGIDAEQASASSEPASVPAAETAPVEVAASEPAADVATEAAESEEPADVGCKKFIPAIGVTVSVGCDK